MNSPLCGPGFRSLKPFLFASFTALALAGVARADGTPSFTVNNVRVQVLSPTLVRLEVKGPKGFEDRLTYHVVNRDWSGTAATSTVSGGNTLVSTARWKVSVPTQGTALSGVTITSPAGATLWNYTSLPPNQVSLPAPSSANVSWAIADTPRMIPAPWGFNVAPAGSASGSTNGWDLNNDAADLYVFLPDGDNRALRAEFNRLTGSTGMVPLHAFGAWDSHYYEYTETTALQQIADYRNYDFPLDNLVIDTDWRVGHGTGYQVNSGDFPDIARFFQRAHAAHARVVFNDHPQSVAGPLDPQEVAVRNNGTRSLLAAGLDVWWYDRNWSPNMTFPAGLTFTNWGTYVYAWIMADFYPDRRQLSMSNVDGFAPELATHRYPIQWTGDIYTGDASVSTEVATAVDEGVFAGYPYTSSDLGGHNGDPTPTNYVHWIQFGALSPILRVHGHENSTRTPWSYGAAAESISRDYYRLRYRLLPLFYGLAHENYLTGMPMLRRCDFDYPAFPAAADPSQYLLGTGVLAAPTAVGSVNLVPTAMLTTPDGSPGLKGEYFTNTALIGTPTLSRIDPNVNFNWSGTTPGGGIPANNFAVRWTGNITVGTQATTLSVLSDDGVRLYLDGNKVLDNWGPLASDLAPASIALAPGTTHSLRLEYLQLNGDAICKLTLGRNVWIPPGSWTDVWTGNVLTGPQTLNASLLLAQVPLYVRAGTVVPLAPEMSYTGQKPWDPVTLDVYPATDRVAQASLYEDDGLSNGYTTGAYRITAFQAATDLRAGRVTVTIPPAQGTYAGALANRAWNVRVHPSAAAAGSAVSATVDGSPATWTLLSRDAGAMPFANSGGSPDGDVVNVAVPSGPVSVAHTVVVTYTPTTFGQWSSLNFTSSERGNPSLLTADNDNDGIANLLEYALNLDPKSADVNKLPVAQVSGGRLALVYPRSKAATDLAYSVEVADSPAGPWRSGPGFVTESVLADGGPWQTIRAVDAQTNPAPDPARRFLRLRVSKP